MATAPQYPNNSGYDGARGQSTDATDYGTLDFVVRQILAQASTCTLVRVISCTNDGGLSPVGRVDVLPLVNQIDGLGNAVPHGVLHSLPYMRVQGGANAVILDPAPGDIGMAVFADHDISSVKATGAAANPGSRRRFDMADGVYIGGMLNGSPSQYVAFSDVGITLVSPVRVIIQTPVVEIQGDLQATGSIISGFDTADQVGLQTHTHDQPVDSHGDTEQPTLPPTPE